MLCEMFCSTVVGITFVSDTTRKPRPGETDGKGLEHIFCLSDHMINLATEWQYYCHLGLRNLLLKFVLYEINCQSLEIFSFPVLLEFDRITLNPRVFM